MNELEQICLRVKNTPQPLWFEQRYKPIMNWVIKEVENDPKFYHEIKAPFLQMMGMTIFYIIYDGYIYIFTYAKIGQVIDWYRVEKFSPTSPKEGYIVSSSDDDPNQDRTVPLLYIMTETTSPAELYKKLLP